MGVRFVKQAVFCTGHRSQEGEVEEVGVRGTWRYQVVWAVIGQGNILNSFSCNSFLFAL
jgi:hypothetical protein